MVCLTKRLRSLGSVLSMRRSDVIDRFCWISLLVAHELTPQGLDRIHGTDDSNMNNTRTLVKGNGESKSHEQKAFHFLR